MNKKIHRTLCRAITFVAILGAASSCKDFLDLEPHGSYTLENFYQNPDQAQAVVYGAYAQLASMGLYADMIPSYLHMDTDECRMVSDVPKDDWRNFCLYTVNASNPDSRKFYENLYKLVNRANDPIDNIPLMDIWVDEGGWDAAEPSEDLKTLRRLYAEAIFLRAIAYNDLMNFYGDVPAKFTVSKPTDDLSYDIPRENRDLIYDRIISEMEKYVEWLPWANEAALEERVTQGAGRGLLARIALRAAGEHLYWDPETYDPSSVYLGNRDQQQEKIGLTYRYSVEELYQIARDQCKIVIDKNVHSLNPDYKNIWTELLNSRMDGQYYERMFEAGIFKYEDGGGHVGSYNSVYVNWNEELTFGEGKNYNQIVPSYYAHFNQADSRLMVTCWPVRMSKEGMIDGYRNANNIQLGKFRRWWITTPFKSRNNTDVNWCLLRYSDVLLMFAEATWWLEGGKNNEHFATSNPEAVEAFNKVRRRAFGIDQPGQPAKSWPADVSAASSISFDDINYERWFEFGGEYIRKWDLFRWGKMEEYLLKARTDMADLRYGSNSDAYPLEWTGYQRKKFVAPYNQTFIDASGSRPYRYYWTNFSNGTALDNDGYALPPTMAVEPHIVFVDTSVKMKIGADSVTVRYKRNNLMNNLTDSEINYANNPDLRGVARYFTNKYKKSLVPIPQKVLDNSRNTKQSPFLQLPDNYVPATTP